MIEGRRLKVGKKTNTIEQRVSRYTASLSLSMINKDMLVPLPASESTLFQ